MIGRRHPVVQRGGARAEKKFSPVLWERIGLANAKEIEGTGLHDSGPSSRELREAIRLVELDPTLALVERGVSAKNKGNKNCDVCICKELQVGAQL